MTSRPILRNSAYFLDVFSPFPLHMMTRRLLELRRCCVADAVVVVVVVVVVVAGQLLGDQPDQHDQQVHVAGRGCSHLSAKWGSARKKDDAQSAETSRGKSRNID